MKKHKLAILTSHPIQYQVPLFRKIAEHPEIDLMVLFSRDDRVNEPIDDPEFGRKIKWDIPLFEGYNYVFLKSPFAVIRELNKARYDVVLAHGWNYFINWLTFLTVFFKQIPVFLHGENPLNQELLKPRWKLAVKKIIFKLLFKRISAFLYIGEENRKFYRYYGVPEEKLFFCPYAVDNSRFIAEAANSKSQITNYKNKLGIGENDVVILFVGKLIEKKRPMDLLKAFLIIRTSDVLTCDVPRTSQVAKSSRISDVHLLFVGDGALRLELEKYVKEHNLSNVHFVGFKNQTELPQYYAMADVFVLPSGVGETWGLVVNEAMCFGLPVIVSDIVGCGPDLVENGKNGFVFPLGNVEQLAERLRELIKDNKKRQSFGKKSFEIVNGYSYDKDVQGILTALKKVAKH